MVASYRGVCEGARNMYPTAASQVLEVVVKLIFGIGLAFGAREYGLYCWRQGLSVFGQGIASSEKQALTWSVPFIAVGGMIGVTLGALSAMLYMIVRHRVRGDGIAQAQLEAAPPASSMRGIFKALLAMAIPIALGTLGWQIALLVDAVSLNGMLAYVIDHNGEYFAAQFGHLASSVDKIQDYLLANRGTAMTYVNLIPNVTLSLGISALPVITAAWAAKNQEKLRTTVNMVVRITLMIAIPSGLGIAVLARPLMSMIYGAGRYQIAGGMLEVLGFAIIFICLSAPLNAVLQAMGRSDVPIKSAIIGGVIKLVFNIVLIGIPQINIMGAAYSMIACYTVMVVYSLFMLQRILVARLEWGRIVLKPLIAAVACVAAAWGINRLMGGMIHYRAATALAIAAAVGVYAALLFLLKAITKDELKMLMKR
jgi:stage V sporulation protein B